MGRALSGGGRAGRGSAAGGLLDGPAVTIPPTPGTGTAAAAVLLALPSYYDGARMWPSSGASGVAELSTSLARGGFVFV